MPQRLSVPVALILASFALSICTEAQAYLLYAEGESGNFGTVQQSAGPSASGPLGLPSGAIDVSGRFADFGALVSPGVIRLSATAGADLGAQSVGNWTASARGSWEDSIVFAAPTSIPSLPGVEIISGVTAGRAELVVDLSGILDTAATDNIARASYSASLGYGELAPFEERCCGPKYDVFGGEVSLFGERNGALPPHLQYDGDPLPNELRLAVDFIYGVPFDVIFELSVHAEVGWEGLASEPLFAAALLDQSAVWQGPQNVLADVDDGLGGILSVALPDGSWSFASDTFDYSTPVAAPEPTTSSLLLGLGLAMLAIRARAASRTGHRSARGA